VAQTTYIRSYTDGFEGKTAPRLSLGESPEKWELAHYDFSGPA